jgi:hypothetical protein
MRRCGEIVIFPASRCVIGIIGSLMTCMHASIGEPNGMLSLMFVLLREQCRLKREILIFFFGV